MATEMQGTPATDADVLVLGGGPAGATAALVLARAGCRTVLVEPDPFPRFHVGESLLPKNTELLRELGILDRMSSIPHTEKRGVEFAFGHDPRAKAIEFADGLEPRETLAFNVERASFDAMLLQEAAGAGVEILSGVRAKEIHRLQDGDCRIGLSDRELSSRYVLDATGQATFLARRLKTRIPVPDHRRVAYYGHFEGVERLPGHRAGFPTIAMMRDAWFWSIPLDAERTSLGVVLDRDVAAKLPIDKDEVLGWAVGRCPLLRARTRTARMIGQTHVAADYSYRCNPVAGPGYFLVGDAATFVDPIFSTGVCLGMQSGRTVAESVLEILSGKVRPDRARKAYSKWMRNSCAVLFKLVDQYYTAPFRDLWFESKAPLQIAEAVISLLAGEVFPRPSWALRWRYRWLETATRVQRRIPIATRKPTQSILDPAGD